MCIYGNYVCISKVSSISVFRFDRRPHGPSPRVLPRLCWLQCSRCPESWLRLTLGHSIHHLCATQPVSSSLRHALPSPLPLLSLSENHISEGSGEELYLNLNAEVSSATLLSQEEVVVISVCTLFFISYTDEVLILFARANLAEIQTTHLFQT